MTYDRLKAIFAEHAPSLFIDPEVAGQLHVNIRKSEEDTSCHSLMIPTGSDEAAEADLVSSINIIKSMIS